MKKVLSYLLITAFIISMFTSCEKKTSINVGGKSLDTTKTYNICISQSSESAYLDEMRKGFIVGLKDKGLVEDVNVHYSFENAKGETAFATQIAEAFISKKPDLVVGIGEKSSIALNDIFKDTKTPVLSIGIPNAEKLGFCKSDKTPLSNITGTIDSLSIDTILERISINYPSVKKLGIICDSTGTLASYQVDYYKFYGTAFGIDIYTVSINKTSDIDKAIGNLLSKVDGVALIIDEKLKSAYDAIIRSCNEANKPVFGYELEDETKGAKMLAKFSKKDIGYIASIMAKEIIVDGKKTKEIKFVEIDPKPFDEFEEFKEGE